MSDYFKELAKKLNCKPCPFCGGTAKVFLLGHNKGGISCSKCGAGTKTSHGGKYLRLETARDYWNRRTGDDKSKDA